MDEDEKLFERLSSAVPSIEQCTVEEVLDLLYELLRLRTIEGVMVIFNISKCARGTNPGVSAHAYGSY